MKFTPILFLFLMIILSGCKPDKKDIQFEIDYKVDPSHIVQDEKGIKIDNFPLFLQAQAEKNFTKKSQVNTIQLIAIESNVKLYPEKFKVINKNNWEKIYETPSLQHIISKDYKYHYTLLSQKWNFVSIFKDKDYLTMRFYNPEMNEEEMRDVHIKLTFRVKAKLDRTNIVYRIVG